MNGFDFYTVVRFWSKVRVGRPTECWTWDAALSDKGYGRFKMAGKLELPHRVAYCMCKGPIPEGEGYQGAVVMHRCDNPRCVNPEHLSIGSQSENMRDCVTKGRLTHRTGRIPPEIIQAIIDDPRPLREAAKIYGVSRTRVHKIRQDAKAQRPANEEAA